MHSVSLAAGYVLPKFLSFFSLAATATTTVSHYAQNLIENDKLSCKTACQENSSPALANTLHSTRVDSINQSSCLLVLLTGVFCLTSLDVLKRISVHSYDNVIDDLPFDEVIFRHMRQNQNTKQADILFPVGRLDKERPSGSNESELVSSAIHFLVNFQEKRALK